ncbi:Rhomboid-like protein 20 [Dionaea muscipula]
MSGGPSGFNNAPVTRAFIIASALFSIVFGIQGRSNKLGLSFQNLRPWKLIASVFAFSSTPELLFGLYLMYYFRVFERQIGSNKYSVFIVFSLITSLVLEVAALVLLKDAGMNLITSGPYGLIFSSFVQFYFGIPISSRYIFFGFRFSDKSFIYLAGLQLLLSSWKRSILPGMCGILAGFLYGMNFFYVRRIKFPHFMASFFSRFSGPSTSSSSSASAIRNIMGNLPAYAGRGVERNNRAPVLAAVEPPEESISTLVSMGFDRNAARQALVQARNDINAATNILLEA